MGSISFREFIRWLPDEASEPTSTIVLTSPGRRFVDIRVLHPIPAQGTLGKLPPERLDWAIAGTSSCRSTKDPKVTKGRWDHWIDSRTVDTVGLFDEGVNTLRPDGKTLETGEMVNPATGQPTEYEELWRDEDPGAGPGSKVAVLELDGEAKGSIILLGRICQAVRRGTRFSAERWEWDSAWTRTVSVGEDILSAALLETSFRPGATVAIKNEDWKVVESE